MNGHRFSHDLETRKAPLDIAVTVEIIGFIEAAWKSAQNHGSGEQVPV